MKKLRHNTGRTNVGKGIAYVIMIALALMGLALIMITSLIQAEMMDMSDAGMYSAIVVMIATCLGSLIGSISCDEQYMIAICGGSAGYFVILCLLNALLFQGTFPGGLTGALMTILGAVVAVAVKVARKRTGKKGYRNRRYR